MKGSKCHKESFILGMRSNQQWIGKGTDNISHIQL